MQLIIYFFLFYFLFIFKYECIFVISSCFITKMEENIFITQIKCHMGNFSPKWKDKGVFHNRGEGLECFVPITFSILSLILSFLKLPKHSSLWRSNYMNNWNNIRLSFSIVFFFSIWSIIKCNSRSLLISPIHLT